MPCGATPRLPGYMGRSQERRQRLRQQQERLAQLGDLGVEYRQQAMAALDHRLDPDAAWRLGGGHLVVPRRLGTSRGPAQHRLCHGIARLCVSGGTRWA